MRMSRRNMRLEELCQEQNKESTYSWLQYALFVCVCMSKLNLFFRTNEIDDVYLSMLRLTFALHWQLTLCFAVSTVNKHKPWIETSYHGVITENTDIVLLDPPLVALDKDAPIPYAGIVHFYQLLMAVNWRMIITTAHSDQMEAVNGDSGVNPHRGA